MGFQLSDPVTLRPDCLPQLKARDLLFENPGLISVRQRGVSFPRQMGQKAQQEMVGILLAQG